MCVLHLQLEETEENRRSWVTKECNCTKIRNSKCETRKTWKFVIIQIVFPRVAFTEDDSTLNKLNKWDLNFSQFPIRVSCSLISSGSVPSSDRFIPGPDQLKDQKYLYTVVRGGTLDWGIALQVGMSRVQFPVASVEFVIDTILPTAPWPWNRLSH